MRRKIIKIRNIVIEGNIIDSKFFINFYFEKYLFLRYLYPIEISLYIYVNITTIIIKIVHYKFIIIVLKYI